MFMSYKMSHKVLVPLKKVSISQPTPQFSTPELVVLYSL